MGYNLGGDGNDQGFGVAVDGSGNSYVTGVDSGNIFVAKFDSNGTPKWTTNAAGGTGNGFGIAVDGSGSSYVTGNYSGTVTFAPGVLDQSNVGAETAGTAIGSDFAAQVITAGRSGILASVDFAIRKFDGVTFGDITVQVRGVTSGAPNSMILGSKTFPNSSIAPTPSEFTTFDLRSLNLFLRAGDVFSVAVFSANQSGSPFPIALTDNLYAAGSLQFYKRHELGFVR